MSDLSKARTKYISEIVHALDYDDRREFSIVIAKRHLEYAFSKEFSQVVEDEIYRELHPALKDLHNQYKEMEALLKKEDKAK